MTGYVVDASVAVKWLVSEALSEEAVSVRSQATRAFENGLLMILLTRIVALIEIFHA